MQLWQGAAKQGHCRGGVAKAEQQRKASVANRDAHKRTAETLKHRKEEHLDYYSRRSQEASEGSVSESD